MPQQWPILLIIGVLAGVLSGMFGIGGGVIIVPALAIIASFNTVEAISTSLAALLLPVGIFAVIAYYRAGLLRLRYAAWVALGLLLTSYLGASLTLSLPADTLRRVYGVFLLYNSWRFIEPRKLLAEWQSNRTTVTVAGTTAPAPKSKAGNDVVEIPLVPWYWVFGVGLISGVASGMFGIGGGVVIVPALVAMGFDQKLAVGTSLAALLLPVGLPGVLRYAADGALDFQVAFVVAFGLLIGAIFGAQIALNLPSKTVKRLYGVFLFFVALRFILQ
ncbi:MAG: hypothetical protein OHK0046_13120 [Anaerolineae bacterium]